MFTQHKVKVFVYNQQVVDSITESSWRKPTEDGVPVVGVYETMPVPGYDYQTWMLARPKPSRRRATNRPCANCTCTDEAVAMSRRERRHDACVALEGVSVWLSGRLILDDVSFSVGPGEFTGLIGSNGAGKTTLLRVILGLQRPTVGQVSMDGGAPPATGRSGYVPQKVLLDPGHAHCGPATWWSSGSTVTVSGFPLPSRPRRRAVDEMLEAVDATGFADTRVGRLSGGEQQRVLIAHALVARPELLLLDEPLANLDLRSGHEIVELLHRITSEHGSPSCFRPTR